MVMTAAEGKMIMEIYPLCLREYERQRIRKYQVNGRRGCAVVQIRGRGCTDAVRSRNAISLMLP